MQVPDRDKTPGKSIGWPDDALRTCREKFHKLGLGSSDAIMHTNLLAPLLAGFAGVKKLALGLLFPNAGAGGGALTEVREANEKKEKL